MKRLESWLPDLLFYTYSKLMYPITLYLYKTKESTYQQVDLFRLMSAVTFLETVNIPGVLQK